MEIFGSLHLTEKTNKAILEYSKEIIKTLTDDNFKSQLSRIVDLSRLKYRERDDIEFVVNFWNNEKKNLDCAALWDRRVRQHLQARYDQKDNVVDWDYNMKVLNHEHCKLITKREYLHWRFTGNCFKVRDLVYNKYNRTLATVDTMKVVDTF